MTHSLDNAQLLAFDNEYIWHPYSRPGSDAPMYAVESADDCYLNLASGERIFDGMSSWWSAIHGYNHPRMNAAASEQMSRMSHVMFGGLTHEPAVKLAQTLIDITPDGLNRIFLCDSGSVSVEVALKMAIQYWNSLGQNRHTFLSLKKGYHGDTFGAMSVCDPITGMHQLFADFLNKNIFADAPTATFGKPCNEDSLTNINALFAEHHQDLAAVVLEPIVQGAGGMRFYSADFLQHVRQLCDDYGILLIADEIATGFGRTGKLFACEHANISPDILCLGKALTGGYLSLAATLSTQKVAETVCAGEAGVFMHGPTFMGNPLSCAVANASIELLLEQNWAKKIAAIEDGLSAGLDECRELDGVGDVRTLGAIGVVELDEAVDMKKIVPQFVKQGIWLRPFGSLVYTMPPFIASEDEIQMLTGGMARVLRDYLR